MNLDPAEIPNSPRPASDLYISPQDVLDDPVLTTDQKRELLASWASDMRAVENAPALRQLDNGAIVLIDDILDALKALDDAPARMPAIKPELWHSRLQNAIHAATRTERKWSRRWYRNDNDDDPPPCPVAARPPRPLPILDGAYAA